MQDRFKRGIVETSEEVRCRSNLQLVWRTLFTRVLLAFLTDGPVWSNAFGGQVKVG